MSTYQVPAAALPGDLQIALQYRPVQATAYTANPFDLVPCDTTAGAWTGTLPLMPANGTVVGFKLIAQAGTNAVTVTTSGTDVINKAGGGTTVTLSVLNQGVVLQYESGIWTITGDDLPLAGLDHRYANVFSPLAYGAIGNGTTDDTTALQACAAAVIAAKGVMDLGTYTFKTSSPITLASYFHLRGSVGGGGGTITNSASDLFTIPSGSCFYVTIENCTLTAAGSGTGGGHIFNASASPSMSFWRIFGVTASQSSTSHSIWYQTGGGWIDCIVDHDCFFSCAAARVDTGCGTSTVTPNTVTDTHAVSGDAGMPISNANIPLGTTITAVTPGTGYTISGAGATATASSQTFLVGGATVAPWYMYELVGNLNSVQFKRMRALANFTSAVPFFSFDMGAASGYGQNIVLDSITFEECVGGCIYMTGCAQITVNQCVHWDATSMGSAYSFAASTNTYPCRDIIIRQSGNLGQNTAYPDISATSTCTNILLDSCGTWATPATYSTPANQTTVLNPTVSFQGLPTVASFPGVAVTAGPVSVAPFSSATTTGTVTLSPLNGSYQRIAMTGNVTLAAPTSNQVDGQDLVVELTQPASGGPYTGTWNAAFIFQGGTTAPALSTAASAVDLVAFRWNATASKWIEQYRRLGYVPSASAGNDPLSVGMDTTVLPPTGSVSTTMGGTSAAYYMRLVSGGYAMSNVAVFVTTSAGNMSAAAYTRSGSGASAQPTGGQLSTSGAVAVPALGYAAVALGASVTPNISDFLAISGDTSTTAYAGPSTPISTGTGTMFSGWGWDQTAGHPLPSTPSSLAVTTARSFIIRGQ